MSTTKLFLQWLVAQLISSLIMSLFVAYIVLGDMSGYEEPSYQLILVLFLIFILSSLTLGLPLLLLLVLKKKRIINNLFYFIAFMLSLSIMIGVAIIGFSMDTQQFIGLCISYIPPYFIIFNKNW